jgi:hypothetical protein
MSLNDEIIAQIDDVLKRYRALRGRSQYSDLSDLRDESTLTAIATLMSDTVYRLAPPGSQYVQSVEKLMRTYGTNNSYVLPHVAGTLDALRDAYEAGYIKRFAELVHAELFTDFQEMAEYLLNGGYKDPAAVIIGSVLEEHLRQLCTKNGIDVTVAGKAKKAEQLNNDLAGASVYTKLDQKSVTSWLDLRNKAAHGKYTEYAREQVELLLMSVQNFLSRVPA